MARLICVAGAIFFTMATAVVAQPAALAQAAVDAEPAKTTPDDVVHPGDVVRLQVWREPDLSGEFRVDETDSVGFPMIGRIGVAGETPGSLRARLVGIYQEYLSHSSIEVTVLRRVKVLGAVRTPGLYPIDPTMTIEDALALAGGVAPDGDPEKLELRRRGERVPIELSRQMRLDKTPVRSGDEIVVPTRGWFSRNPFFLTAIVTGTLSLLIQLARR